jgi:E3 ubiquitin-protein ligase UBR3
MAASSSLCAHLYRKGRKAAAAGVKDLCLKAATASTEEGTSDTLDAVEELLRDILDPNKPISEPDNIDWLQFLLAGGDSFEDFAAKFNTYDEAITCGFVWTSNFVAYRCRTCGVSPCMSLCAECFHMGDHEGHDFNMFRSQAGGACDCGDVSVMKKEGFCTRHGPDHVRHASKIPVELSCVPEVILPQVDAMIRQTLNG